MRNKEAAPASSTKSKTGDNKEAATPTRRKKVSNAGSVKAVADAAALPTGSAQLVHQKELVKADSVESESLKAYIDSEPADDDADVLPTLPAFPDTDMSMEANNRTEEYNIGVSTPIESTPTGSTPTGSTPDGSTGSGADVQSSGQRKIISSEEEAKAAFAEKRRLAREQMEREAERERMRIEEEQRQEAERLRMEELEQKKNEEEMNRLAQHARVAEEERLQKAIEEAQRREEEDKLRREEEARQRMEKEQQEKKAREEARRGHHVAHAQQGR